MTMWERMLELTRRVSALEERLERFIDEPPRPPVVNPVVRMPSEDDSLARARVAPEKP